MPLCSSAMKRIFIYQKKNRKHALLVGDYPRDLHEKQLYGYKVTVKWANSLIKKIIS